ncbi:MAG: hypothetical protein PHV82_06110 [Victivallaceae bacterium]|nr:hypothetical protein [Victivallaceae bacterium]
MMFASRQKEIQEQVSEYCASVVTCMDSFQNAVKRYCGNMDRAAAKAAFAEVHRAESKADDIRRGLGNVRNRPRFCRYRGSGQHFPGNHRRHNREIRNLWRDSVEPFA